MWRIFFIAAAVFNFLAGAPMLFAPELMLQSLQVPVPNDLMFHRVTGLLVVCFGVIYGMIAMDLARYRPLVWLGIVGKGGVVALFTHAYVQGLLPFNAYAVSLGDLAFTIGFLWFVLTPKAVAAKSL